MGVQGLWELLEPAAQSRSLSHLAIVDGFERNTSGRRALRVGIDASLWYQHASSFVNRAGEKRDIGANPDIRLLFFRLANLSELPMLPLFVFDGRQRPKVKRGSRKGKSGSHHLTQKMKELLEVFGMEWRMALGEAEAELAYLNRTGVIDVIMTDDVDVFLFGAKAIIRNSSLQLTGNRSNPAVNLDGKAAQTHVKMYIIEDIREHPAVRLTRGGMILIALLSGGDYNNGVSGFGEQIAYALAMCGFGDQLLDAYQRTQAEFRVFLPHWRQAVNQELQTNSKGHLSRRSSARIPDTFPDLDVMEAYANPICNGCNNGDGGYLRDKGDLGLAQAAAFCEAHFDEWGYRSAIIKRFRDLLWKSAVMTVLRRAALEADEKEKNRRIAQGRTDLTLQTPLTPLIQDAVGTPASLVQKYLSRCSIVASNSYADIFVNQGTQNLQLPLAHVPDPYPLLKEIVGVRNHVSTDYLPEYRVVIDPRQLVDLAQVGIRGKHSEPPEGSQRVTKKPPPEPHSVMRLWLPASMLRQVHPQLVEDYETAQAAKTAGGTPRRRKRQRATSANLDGTNEPETSLPLHRSIDRETHSAGNVVHNHEGTASARHAAPSRTPPATTRPIVRRNVGWIESELPISEQVFFFTFTNPDEPDEAEGNHRQNDNHEPPALTISNANIPPTAIATSSGQRKGKQRETRPVIQDVADNDEWEEPLHAPSALDRYDAMFDRILGLAQPRAKAGGSSSASRKRAGAPAERNQTEKRRRTATSANASASRTPIASPAATDDCTRTSTVALSSTTPSARRTRQEIPLLTPLPRDKPTSAQTLQNRDRHPDSNTLRQKHSQPARFSTRTPVYPSSSQESGPDGFFADVNVFKDLTTH